MLPQFQRSEEPLLTKSALEIARFEMSFPMVSEKCDFCEAFSAFQALVRFLFHMDADMGGPEILVLKSPVALIADVFSIFIGRRLHFDHWSRTRSRLLRYGR